MFFSLQTVGFILVLIWLAVLTYLEIRSSSRFRSIFKETKEQKVSEVLEKLVKENTLTIKETASLLTRIETLEEQALTHFQKIGLLRFNPFKDTGGEQSFILTLLDSGNSGIVISGLYARSGMRWYVKKIVNGKGIEHELSEEENKAVEMAK